MPEHLYSPLVDVILIHKMFESVEGGGRGYMFATWESVQEGWQTGESAQDVPTVRGAINRPQGW